jgi:hypothetical protein
MNAQMIGSRYQPAREIARSQLATSWKARDTWLGNGVVLVQPAVSDYRAFERAAISLRQDLSPHLSALYDAGSDKGRPFAVMERPAVTLADRDHAWSQAQALQIGLAVSAGLEAWHEAGLVHGELHPGTVGFDQAGNPRLAPWPLAPAPRGWGGASAWRTSPRDPRSGSKAGDLWSVGALLLSALAGSAPHVLNDQELIELAGTLAGRAPEVARVALRAMTPVSEGGYPSAAALHEQLAAAEVRPLPLPRPIAPVARASSEADAGQRVASFALPRSQPVAVGAVAAAAAAVVGLALSAALGAGPSTSDGNATAAVIKPCNLRPASCPTGHHRHASAPAGQWASSAPSLLATSSSAPASAHRSQPPTPALAVDHVSSSATPHVGATSPQGHRTKSFTDRGASTGASAPVTTTTTSSAAVTPPAPPEPGGGGGETSGTTTTTTMPPGTATNGDTGSGDGSGQGSTTPTLGGTGSSSGMTAGPAHGAGPDSVATPPLPAGGRN